MPQNAKKPRPWPGLSIRRTIHATTYKLISRASIQLLFDSTRRQRDAKGLEALDLGKPVGGFRRRQRQDRRRLFSRHQAVDRTGLAIAQLDHRRARRDKSAADPVAELILLA